MSEQTPETFLEKLAKITTFIFDIDGVFTDGTFLILENGEAIRSFNVKDGYALQLAIKKGYQVCIISGGKGSAIEKRFANLNVTDLYLGIQHKMEAFDTYIQSKKVNPSQILYMGDDIPDYHVMQLVRLPTCPQDASPEIKAICQYISHKNGGKGAVRDVIEQVMKVQGKWHLYYDGKHD